MKLFIAKHYSVFSRVNCINFYPILGSCCSYEIISFFLHSSWHIDNTTTNSTTYLITGINRTQQYFDTVWGYSYEPCPIDGCPDPPDPNAGPQEDKYDSLFFSFSSFPVCLFLPLFCQLHVSCPISRVLSLS